jgi:hypothetical protein
MWWKPNAPFLSQEKFARGNKAILSLAGRADSSESIFAGLFRCRG